MIPQQMETFMKGCNPLGLEHDLNAPKKRTWEMLSYAHGQLNSERF
jgi:hypothetical protein